MRIPCAYCGRARPRRIHGGRPAGVHGALSPGYAGWRPGAAVCCDATTRLPFTPMKPACLPGPEVATVTVGLYADEAHEIGAGCDEETELRPSVGEIAQQILELSDAESYALFHSEPRRTGGSPATPEQATAAIDRLLAGEDPEDIWTARRGPSHAMVKNP